MSEYDNLLSAYNDAYSSSNSPRTFFNRLFNRVARPLPEGGGRFVINPGYPGHMLLPLYFLLIYSKESYLALDWHTPDGIGDKYDYLEREAGIYIWPHGNPQVINIETLKKIRHNFPELIWMDFYDIILVVYNRGSPW